MSGSATESGGTWPRCAVAQRSQAGAVLVEAAVAFPLLVLLIFSMIDMGSVFNDYQAVRQGTREGARQAAVLTTPQPPSGTWSSNGCQTTGITTSGDGYDLVCYTKNRIGLNQATTRVSVEFTPHSPAPAYSAGQGVIICTQYPATSASGFMSSVLSGHILTSKIEIRIEQPSTTFATSVQETPLAGTSWPASCSTP